MLLFRLRGIPVVTTVHNIAGHESKRSFRFATNRLIALSNVIITHLADPPAEFVKFVRRRTGRDPVHVPHGLLDLYRQAPQKLDPPILAQGEKGILFFGAIRPYKGLDILLEAFEIVQKNLPTARLVIVGRPWEPWDRYARQIESQLSRDRVIARLGYIPTNEVAGYFDTCEIVVAPYLQFNSQSGAALSAIGMGKPLIVTQVGGLPELQPIADYVIPPGNPRLLADAILRALGDRQELDRLADASRQVADRMNWDHIADETSKIYESLLFRAVTES
jgi:glycosyltransferase involved in cell wall biosynthesis